MSDRASSAGRWVRNVASGYAGVAIEGLVFLALTPVFVHHLGVHGYALWVLAGSIVFYLKFLDFGFEGAQIRYHARFEARGQTDALRRLTHTVVLSLAAAGVVALATGLLIAASPVFFRLDISAAELGDFKLLMALLAVELFVVFPASGLSNLYEGAQRFDLRNLRGGVLLIGKSAAQVIALLLGHGLLLIAAIEVVATCVQLLVDLVILQRLLPGLLQRPVRFDLNIWRRIRGFALWSFVDDLLMSGTANLGNLLIAAFLPLATLTPYSLCVTVAQLVLHVIHPVADTLFPMASRLHAQRRHDDLAALLIAGTKGLLVLSAPVALVLATTGRTFIELWVPAVRGQIPDGFVALLAMDTLVSVMLSTSTVVLIAINGIRSFVLMTLAEIVLFAVLSALLAPGMQLVGLAIAALAANVAIGFGMQLPLVARLTTMPLTSLVGRPILRTLAACVPALALALLTRHWSHESISSAAMHAAAIGGVCLIGLLLVGTSRKEREYYRQIWNTARTA